MKRTWRPFLYLGIAVVVALVILIVENPERPRVEDVAEQPLIADPNYDVAAVERVEISQLISGTQLKREETKWLVEEMVTPLRKQLLQEEERALPILRWHLADAERIENALGVFSGLMEGTLVSDNPEKQALYQVDDQTGLRLVLSGKNDRKIADLIIGKSGPDATSTYVRREGENRVFLVPRTLVGRFSPEERDWRKRTLWQLQPKAIEAIEIKSPERVYSITRAEDDRWSFEGSEEGEVSGDEAADIVRRFVSAQAVGFDDEVELADAGLLYPPVTVKILRREGAPLTLKIGRHNEAGKYYAQLEGVDETYLLSPEYVRTLPLKPPSKEEEEQGNEQQ